MKIFAFRFSCIQKEQIVQGIHIEVGTDCLEEENKLIKKIEGNNYKDVEEGSVQILDRTSLSLESLVRKLKPEFEKLVKTAKIKSELLDAISKLPVD